MILILSSLPPYPPYTHPHPHPPHPPYPHPPDDRIVACHAEILASAASLRSLMTVDFRRIRPPAKPPWSAKFVGKSSSNQGRMMRRRPHFRKEKRPQVDFKLPRSSNLGFHISKKRNIQNNQFTGWVPDGFRKIGNLQAGGNSWSSGRAPPHYHMYANDKDDHFSGKGKSSVINGLAIGGATVAVLFLIVVILTLMKKKRSATSLHYINESDNQGRSFTPLVNHDKDFKLLSSSTADVNVLPRFTSASLMPPTSERNSSFSENDFRIKFNSKRSTEPINACAMLLMDLQAATGGFSASRLLGKGSIGCVFKAKCLDGKKYSEQPVHWLGSRWI